MNKILTIIAIGLSLTTDVMAQEYRRNWNEGRLTWQDFEEHEGLYGTSELKYYLGYNTERQRYGDTVVEQNIAKCYMDKSLSWVNTSYKTDQYLRYNQVIFDIVELHRRRLQFEIDMVRSLHESVNSFNNIYAACEREIAKFDKETHGGDNVTVIGLWEATIATALSKYTDKPVPEYTISNFGYGMHGGLGAGMMTGSLGKHFSPTFNIVIGFDIACKRSILYLSCTLGFGRVKQEYLASQIWNKGMRSGLALIDVSYGYALIDNHRIKLSPFAGLGITEISERSKDKNKHVLGIVDYNLLAGLNVDYKIRTQLALVPHPVWGRREKGEIAIRSRLYVSKVNYYQNLQGYSINLSLGMCVFGNRIKMK